MAQHGISDRGADHHGHGPAFASHSHQGGGGGLAFGFATVLNLGFVVAEAVAGMLGNSVALLSDAGHNLGDVLGLLLAWGASVLVRRRPSRQFTYGLRSTSILAALLNGIILFIVVGGIAAEAIRRLIEPAPVAGVLIMGVAAIGMLINGATALLFGASHHRRDLNLRAVFLHMASDAVISAVVIVVGGAIYLTGALWLDPLSSLAVALFLVIGSWRLMRDSIGMAMHGVPAGLDADAVRAAIDTTPGVAAVHDLHIWPMSTTETALTCHLVMPAGHPGDALLAALTETLHRRFGIEHVKIQVETGDPAHPCVLAPDHVV